MTQAQSTNKLQPAMASFAALVATYEATIQRTIVWGEIDEQPGLPFTKLPECNVKFGCYAETDGSIVHSFRCSESLFYRYFRDFVNPLLQT